MRRRAFTLIELAVVVAIIGIMLALLLPAIQSTRCSARLAQCRDNLKQIGLATAHYMDEQNVLPMSATAGEGRGQNHSCFTMILPQLGEQALFSAYNFQVENYDPANRTVVETKLQVFLCPSSRLSTKPLPSERVRAVDGSMYPAGSAFARNHYGANWGGSRTSLGHEFTKQYGAYRGVMMMVQVDTPRGPTRCIRLKDITDGLSTTLFYAEKRDGQGWAVGGYGGSEFDAGPSPFIPDSPTNRTIATGSYHPDVTNIIHADGSARAFRVSTQKGIWYARLTRDGGEVISCDPY